LALVPLVFAAQQFSEGLVWVGLDTHLPDLVQRASLFFLFFAIPFWPFWIPFCLLPVERKPAGRCLLAAMTLASVIWIWLSFPLFIEPGERPVTREVHHSIQYDIEELPTFQTAAPVVWRSLYLAAICIPILVVGLGHRVRFQLIGGVAVVTGFLISYLVFWYAFTSVWCFFAACLSVYLCYFFRRLPGDQVVK
jgi:hypothetical protein